MTTKNTPVVDGQPVTAKVAGTYFAGEREILQGQLTDLIRTGVPEAQLVKLRKAIVAMELGEAAMTYFSKNNLSPMKAGVEAGFVPYGPSADGGRRPSVLPGRS